ncbi:MAG: pyruvate kinase [Gemmatimonadales bacterium]
MPRESRRTKIVATLGPAWEQPEQMRGMLDAGVDVVRINASHGTTDTRGKWIKDLKEVQGQRDKASAILVDLHGPRIRVGDLEAPIDLKYGEQVTFAPEEAAEAGEIPTTYRELAERRSSPAAGSCSTTASSPSM